MANHAATRLVLKKIKWGAAVNVTPNVYVELAAARAGATPPRATLGALVPPRAKKL